jgi:hypothetical protein
MKKFRFEHRKSIDSFLQPLLNLEIFTNMFTSHKYFDAIPDYFESFSHYIRIMEPLYLYETYCMLSNQRRQVLDPSEK